MGMVYIYPTSVMITAEMGINHLIEVEGFEELLNREVPFNREKELMERSESHGITVQKKVAPDGDNSEWTFDKSDLEIVMTAMRKNQRSAYNMDSLHVRLYELDEAYRDMVRRILGVGRKLGVENDRMMEIFDEVQYRIGQKSGQ